MKKFLSVVAMMLATVVMPLGVSAKITIDPGCPAAPQGGYKVGDTITCTPKYNIPEEEEADSLSIELTEKGGADITDIVAAADSEWEVSSKTEAPEKTWTVLLAPADAPSVSGEGDLFSFTYTVSGTSDCGITIKLGDVTVNTPVPSTPDQPTQNKPTGTTLPYIALGALVIIATSAYFATRNKSKMYKI